MQTNRGKFIVLEGVDGSGTTTQARLLTQALTREGIPCEGTREPSDGPIGKLIRQILEQRVDTPLDALALLFAADRFDHVFDVIDPVLRNGIWIVCDRYVLSSLIYQTMTRWDVGANPFERFTESAPLKRIRAINAGLPTPDLTVVLDVSDGAAAQRREHRGGRPDRYEGRELQRRLVDAYAHASRFSPRERIERVDGEREPEVITADLLRLALGMREVAP